QVRRVAGRNTRCTLTSAWRGEAQRFLEKVRTGRSRRRYIVARTGMRQGFTGASPRGTAFLLTARPRDRGGTAGELSKPSWPDDARGELLDLWRMRPHRQGRRGAFGGHDCAARPRAAPLSSRVDGAAAGRVSPAGAGSHPSAGLRGPVRRG